MIRCTAIIQSIALIRSTAIMSRVVVLLLLVGSVLPLSARRTPLPADSVAVIAQMYDPSAELHDVGQLFDYDKKSVWVNQLVDSFAKVPLSKKVLLHLDVIEGTTSAFRYKIRLGHIPTDIPLTIYVSVEEGARLCINGHAIDYKRKDGYAVLKRKWRSGNEILIQ